MNKPMKPKKRFNTAEEITMRIDKLKGRVTDKRNKASQEDSEADELYRNPKVPTDKVVAGEKRELANKLRNRANVIERQIEGLGRKLAEFRTTTFAFIEDPSVPRT